MKAIQRMIQIPYTFSLMNWAAIAGLFYYLNRHQEFWDLALPASRRRSAASQLRRL
jgi:hypothetical protein